MAKMEQGDGLLYLEQVQEKSIDLILTDPPYAITANDWDNKIDFERFWQAASKAIKPNGAIVVFGNPPFSFDLVTPTIARKLYRYDWIWQKERGSNFQHANRQPMKVHEHVHVFYKKQPTYNPIKTDLDKVTHYAAHQRAIKGLTANSSAAVTHPGGTYIGKFPKSILAYSRDRPMVHSTQKPLALCKYLIQTYTNPGDMVFDPFAGYGTTVVAAALLGRQAVGVELSQLWFDKAKERLSKIQLPIVSPETEKTKP